ncbi:hypothetical protein BsWGS_27748 [Bradybaena similaris]
MNTTTILSNVTTFETPLVTVPADYETDKTVIIAAAGAAAGGLVAILLLVVCWIKCRCSSRSLPPPLPHPDTIRRFDSEPPITDLQSHEHVTRRHNSNHSDGAQHFWEVQEPVIHSSSDASESERISYMCMDKPDRPMSISPPSPKQRAGKSKAVTNNRPPPAACKAAPGYINIPEKKPSVGPIPPRKLSNVKIYNIVIEEVSTNEDVNNLEDYQNVQEIVLSERNNTHNNIKHKEEPSHKSLLNRQLPDLLTSSRVHQHPAEVNPTKSHQKTARNHSEDGCSSDSDTPESPQNCGSPTSYVNVDQYKKRSLVKEPVIIDLSKSGFPELVSNNSSTSETKTQSKPKPPSVQQKAKATRQQQFTEANLSDTYKIRADLYSLDAIKQGKLDQKHRKLSTPTICEENFDGHTSRKASMPTTEISTQPTSTQFLTTGRIQTKHQLKNAGGKTNQMSRCHSYQEEAGLYQNCKAFSKSETKLPQQSPVGSSHRSRTDIQGIAANDSDSAAEFQATKPSVNLIRKIEQSGKLITQTSKVPVGPPKTPLKPKFGHISNMGSTEELSEIRSKLRKVN